MDEDHQRPGADDEPEGRPRRRGRGQGRDQGRTPGDPRRPSDLVQPADSPAADDGLLSPSDSAVPGREGVGRDATGAPVVQQRATNPVVRVMGAVRVVLDRVLAAVCVVMFLVLVLIVSWQVFTRQVLNDPATWTTESAQYTFVVLAMLATAYVFSERGHIAVEILVEKFPPTLQKLVASAVQLTIIFFAVYVFVFGGYRVSQSAWNQNISTLPMSVGQVYLILPLAGVLITYYSLYHLVATLVGTEQAVPETDENLQGI